MTAISPLAIYICYPFCRRKCAFCPRPVASVPAPTKRRYVAALMRELEASARAAAGQEVVALRVGGGQPGNANAQELIELLSCVRANYDVSKDAEFTLKVLPEPGHDVSAWLSMGFHRIDYAVGTTDPFLRNLLGLPPLEEIFFAPYDNIGAALAYGLPGQSEEDLLKSLSLVIEKGAKHITLWRFALSPNTPLWELYEKREGFVHCERRNIPSDDQVLEQFEAAKAMLNALGMAEYLPLRFAFAGYESRYEAIFASGEDLLGFGCFARSRFHGMRFKTTEFVDTYIANSPDFDKIAAEFAIVG